MATFFPWGTIQAVLSTHVDRDFAAVFGHGGEPETSVMQSLFPRACPHGSGQADPVRKEVGNSGKDARLSWILDGTPIESVFADAGDQWNRHERESVEASAG